MTINECQFQCYIASEMPGLTLNLGLIPKPTLSPKETVTKIIIAKESPINYVCIILYWLTKNCT